jgi:hypothetical protein
VDAQTKPYPPARVCRAITFLAEDGVTERNLRIAARQQQKDAAEPLPYDVEVANG